MDHEQHSSAIQAVIADYFRGIYEGDIETLRRVFHPLAQLFGDIKGQPYHRTLSNYLEAVRARRSPESTEAELLARVAWGDTDAFSALYDLYAGALFGLALRILRNQATAEEVLQGVFCEIWEKAGAYDPKLGKPLTWAVTLTRNKAVDRLRRANRRAQLFDPGAKAQVAAENFLPEATNPVLSHETASMARAALASLPQDQRQAIEMAFFGGLTPTEIAAALNQPLGTVKARIRRGMLQLRESLEAFL